MPLSLDLAEHFEIYAFRDVIDNIGLNGDSGVT